jgi:AcrR family transcriptional regulator
VTVAEMRPDGRALRTSRTRAAIIAAHRRLLQDGDLAPTTTRVAEVAGISPRTLFLHFNDLECLFAATADSVVTDVLRRARPTELDTPLPVRTDAFLTNRIDLYDFLTPFVLALRVREHNSPALRARRLMMIEVSREEVAGTFAAELQRTAPASGEYDDALIGLETCISWPSWFHLHDELSLGRAAAHRILRRNVLLLLAPPR